MHKTLPLFFALGAVLLLVAGLHAEDAPRAVTEKAIKAHGGADKLRKPRALHTKIKGTAEVAGGSVTFSGDVYYQPPDRLKTVLDLEVDKMKLNLVQVFNKDKGWGQFTLGEKTQTIEFKDDLADAIKESLHVERVKRLVPLLDDKNFELSSLGEVKINERPAVGVRVEAKGLKPVNLFFDKETGLLTKLEGRGVGFDQKEATQEMYFSDYKAIDSVQLPHKTAIHQDGKKFGEVETTDAQFLDKIEDGEFAKP